MLQKHLQNIRKKPNTFDLLLFFSVSTTYNKDGFRLYDELKRANDDNATDMVRSINSAVRLIWYLGIDMLSINLPI